MVFFSIFNVPNYLRGVGTFQHLPSRVRLLDDCYFLHTLASVPGLPKESLITYNIASISPTTSRIFFLASKPADERFRNIPGKHIVSN